MIRDSRPYRILVVEDNPGDLLIVEELLKETIVAPSILHATSYKGAVDMLADEGLKIEIILLDLTLPDKSGNQLVTNIVEVASAYPIIILTGYADLSFSINSISQGISDYLIKDDLDSNSLYKSIIYAIERKKVSTELRESEKRFSDLFQLSPQPKWVYDKVTGKIVMVNAAACKQYGYAEAEFLGLSMNDLNHDMPANAIHQEGLPEKSFKHRRKSGDIIDVEIYAADINLSGRSCVSILAIDVSEKLNFELMLTEAIIKAQENERYEIGSELHDNVCQILATSNLRLGMMRDTLPVHALPMIRKCMDEIVMASKEIRRLSHQLAPAFYDFRTLEEEFTLLLETANISHRYKTELTFDNEFHKRAVTKELKLNLYRILQEHLSNILKYANGSTISVKVSIQNNNVLLAIADDGVGFNIKAVRNGIGLANMRRRVLLYSGKLDIITSPGKGCTVMAEIPLVVQGEYISLH